MKELEIKIEAICEKYDLPIFPNIRDSVMNILVSAEPSDEDKLEAFDLYDEWLYLSCMDEVKQTLNDLSYGASGSYLEALEDCKVRLNMEEGDEQ